MPVIRFATTVANNMLTVLRDAIDAGAAGGKIKLYTPSMPASPAIAVTSQTLLATLTFSVTSGSIDAKAFTFAVITQDSSADADGTASWARITDSNDVVVFDGDVSTLSGSGVIKLNTTAIKAGGPVAITSGVISLP